MSLVSVGGWTAFAYFLVSCSSPARPPPFADFDGGRISPPLPASDGCVDDAGAPPDPDAQGLCGNMFLTVTSDSPNLYFVIDRSGSMQEVVEGRQKYEAVASAAVSLVRALGPQVNVGAAVFPGRGVTDDDACVPGEEVFPTSPGDPLRVGTCAGDGPITKAFSRAITLQPTGATPTAATLAALLPTLAALPGRTAVVLATDGGPNCNTRAMCDATRCIPNIEHDSRCLPDTNCCDASPFGPVWCLDEIGTRTAVADLFSRGIKTYVVGIPGSAPYGALLDELAVVGGTARFGTADGGTSYYDVEHIAELDAVLASVGATVVLGCHLRLERPPPDPARVNVYLDREIVMYGAPDGWVWSSERDASTSPDGPETSPDAQAEIVDAPSGSEALPDSGTSHFAIDILGASCNRLSSGAVRQVQIVFGCPTGIVK